MMFTFSKIVDILYEMFINYMHVIYILIWRNEDRLIPSIMNLKHKAIFLSFNNSNTFELNIQNSQFFYCRVKIKNQTQCDFCYKYKI